MCELFAWPCATGADVYTHIRSGHRFSLVGGCLAWGAINTTSGEAAA